MSRFPRTFARQLALLTLVWGIAGAANLPAQPAPGSQPARLSGSNTPAVIPIDAPTKRKAGFLAGSGLIILSLLALGTALALVRTFKR